MQDYAGVMGAYRTDLLLIGGDAFLNTVLTTDATHPNYFIGIFNHDGTDGGCSLLINVIQPYAALVAGWTP
jgi:hypothetical protein